MFDTATHLKSQLLARRFGLNWYLLALVLAALLPVIIAAGAAVIQAGSAFRETSADRLNDTVRTLSRAVERELEFSAASLKAVTVLSGQDFRGSDRLEQLRATLGGMVVKEGVTPEQLAPAGGISAAGIPNETLARAAYTRDIAISNLFTDPRSGAQRIAVVAMRGREGSSTHFLGLIIPPDRLVQLLQRSNHATSSILVSVTDGTGRLVARSRNAQRFLGQLVPDWPKVAAANTDSGMLEAISKEGDPYVLSFQKLQGTPGWVIFVGEPLDDFQARWRGPIFGLAIGGLVAIVLALLIAGLISRRIMHPVRALARHAETIAADGGKGATSEIAPSPIIEFEALRESLAASEGVLRRQAEAEAEVSSKLAVSERRYRALAEVGALVFWRGNGSGKVSSAAGWTELTGLPEEDALGDGWYYAVHADDRQQMLEAWNRAVTGDGILDAEFRIKCSHGGWRWVRARATSVADANGNPVEWAGVLEDIDARRKAQARIAHMAMHDSLTDLGNRVLLKERLEEAIARSRKFAGGAVLFVDLDRFKPVNDALGHAVGDAVLRRVARRIKSCVGNLDFVARMGGDEFAIIQDSAGQPNAASILADRLIAALKEPFDVNSSSVVVGASIGIATISPDSTAESLLKQADIALYRVKADGRGSYRFFEPEMGARLQARHDLERDLRVAIKEQQFELHYQPLVDMRSRKLNGFEALIRWHHPKRGMVPPCDFIPVAEETGLIVQIGEWVLLEACRTAAAWPEEVRVSVNISPVQLVGRNLSDVVLGALEMSGMSPSRLDLEITENALLENIEAAMASLLRLREMGCGIVMDDFGAGGSSLGYLRSFPFSKVKIDRAFINDLGRNRESGAIVRAVVGLCHSLGIKSTAEGIEAEEQRDLLARMNCTEGQGYFFGKPAPASQIPAMFRAFGVSESVSLRSA